MLPSLLLREMQVKVIRRHQHLAYRLDTIKKVLLRLWNNRNLLTANSIQLLQESLTIHLKKKGWRKLWYLRIPLSTAEVSLGNRICVESTGSLTSLVHRQALPTGCCPITGTSGRKARHSAESRAIPDGTSSSQIFREQ